MKHLQLILPVTLLMLLAACERDIYHDYLLSNTEVVDYGYMELKSDMDKYLPLSSSLYTHSLNFYYPLVITSSYNKKSSYARIKGFLYNDAINNDNHQKRIKVTQIDELNSLPYTLLPPINSYVSMSTGESRIIKTKSSLDSILSEVQANPQKHFDNPSDVEIWEDIDFEHSYLILVKERIDDYTFSSKDGNNSNIYNLVKHFVFEENGVLNYFISVPRYENHHLDSYYNPSFSRKPCLMGILLNNTDGEVKNIIIRHRNYGNKKIY